MSNSNLTAAAAGAGGLPKHHAHASSPPKGGLPLMMACIMIGYIAGTARSSIVFTTSRMNSISFNGLQKVTSVAHNVSRGDNNNSTTKTTTTTASLNNVIEEIIPPNLLSSYTHEKLQFNVTRSMLRQSRPVVGNTQRLHSYLKKLQSKSCTTVLFLGGSVTAGHNGGGPINAYPRKFMDWLNARYPCLAKNGTVGNHVYKKTQAADSMSHFIFWETVTFIDEFDLVLIEFNIGDSFVKGLPHALEDKGNTGKLKEYQGSWYFEVLLRRLLLLRKPDPVAIVTFNADYIGRTWAMPPYQEPSEARQMLFRNNQEPLKIWVSSIYEVPVFSAVIWMLPLAGRKGLHWQFNRTSNPYNTAAWHADSCCHPMPKGHLLLSLVLAHCIIEEEKIMLSYNGLDTAYGERDFTMDGVMREPLYLSPDEDNMYVRNTLTAVRFDFTDPNAGEKSWEPSIVANSGWSWHADNKDKDKFGFIANGVDGGQHIAISLTGGVYGMVEIIFVVSYENFGVALAWLDETTNNAHKDGLCNGQDNKAAPTPHHLVANWQEHASVPKVDLLDNKLKEGENKTLHICLTPRDEKQKGPDNKFKLLGVRVY
ncbi:hypothetical protein ACHAXR_011284 [Thalassiosira sp. AJA248-18]